MPNAQKYRNFAFGYFVFLFFNFVFHCLTDWIRISWLHVAACDSRCCSFTTSPERQSVPDIKEKLPHVAEDFDAKMETKNNSSDNLFKNLTFGGVEVGGKNDSVILIDGIINRWFTINK